MNCDPSCAPTSPPDDASGSESRPSVDRRGFLGATAAGVALLGAASEASGAAEDRAPSPLIDVNASLGHWPLRRVPLDEPRALVAKLRSHHAIEAWAGTFDGLFHKDLGAANRRLAEECRHFGAGLLQPFGSIDPTRPDWEEELRRCAEDLRMPGLRLHPNYHNYRLDDPAFARLLEQAAARRLIVQVTLVMEDERMMHPLLRVEPVDTAPLAGIVRKIPGLRLVLVNALRTLRAKPLLELIAAGDVSVELSMLEGVGGLGTLLEQVPLNRVLFGSHAPLFYFESALLKLRESVLRPDQLAAIARGNARRLREGRP